MPTMQNTSSALPGVETFNLNAPLVDAASKSGSASDAATQPVQNVQIVQPGDGATASSSPAQPSFQINLTPVTGATLDSLNADLTGVVQSLEARLTTLEEEIAAFNAEWLSGERYQDLNIAIPDESTLVNAIREQYPELFSQGLFSSIAEGAAQNSTLASDGQAQAAELLKLAGAETMLLSSQPEAPMTESIVQLEDRIKTLQAQLEEQSAIRQQVTQQRDLAWESFTALSTKQAELKLERAAANSEVRMGTAAIAPNEAMRGVSLTLSVLLAGVVGLLVAVFVAFLLEYLGKPPLFTRAQSRA
jgi:uncharacterized small protein (DUF1192 family)